MSNLLARYAQEIYWLARHVERAENLARILDVNEAFSRDSRGAQNWVSVIQLYADEAPFEERYSEPDAEAVLSFYLLDASHPGSLAAIVAAARENARALRPLLSTEMWLQLNVFHNRVRALRTEDIAEERLARLLAQIKEACQAHSGITEGTFYRDEGWHFYQLGKAIERADQTTRLLDVKYHMLLPRLEDIGSPLDISQWNALLRSAAGYHAFRRVHPSGMDASRIARFLLLNDRFPRSVRANVLELDLRLGELRARYRLAGGATAMEQLDELRSVLDNTDIEQVLARGLHEFLDWIQLQLLEIGQELAGDFFGLAATPRAATAASGQ